MRLPTWVPSLLKWVATVLAVLMLIVLTLASLMAMAPTPLPLVLVVPYWAVARYAGRGMRWIGIVMAGFFSLVGTMSTLDLIHHPTNAYDTIAGFVVAASVMAVVEGTTRTRRQALAPPE